MNVNSHQAKTQFNGAAVIDETGREIPITEAMIQEACENLAQSWDFPLPSARRLNPVQTGRQESA